MLKNVDETPDWESVHYEEKSTDVKEKTYTMIAPRPA